MSPAQVEVDAFADSFTRNLLDPAAVGARIPRWDEWSTAMLNRMIVLGDILTPQQAWEARLNQWRVMRPVRYRMTFKDVQPYGRIAFDAWQPESDAYIGRVSTLIARVRKAQRMPPDGTEAVYLHESIETKTGLTVEVLCPTPYPTKSDATDLWIRAHLRWMTLHELDEYIQICEERPYHPHRNGMTPTPSDMGQV